MKRQRNETTSSAVAEGYGGTSKQGFLESVKMSRLHCITPWQGRKTSFLSEERLTPREEKPCGLPDQNIFYRVDTERVKLDLIFAV